MIAYLPQPYEDELAFSWVSRAYAQSGYMHYSCFAQEVFAVSTVRPDFEFINPYSFEFFSLLTKYKSFAEIICNHTMFPYYARFMPKSRRIEAYNTLIKVDLKSFYQRISMNKSKTCEVRHLRYCPLCVGEDREKFGETYWHRGHQIRHISICPLHSCTLINSPIQITSTASPILITAEACIDDMTVTHCTNTVECQLARYVSEVFQSPLNIDSEVDIGEFFTFRLIGTPYLSRRGEKRYIDRLHRDYLQFYSGVDIEGFHERWHIDKFFSSPRYNTFSVCLMAVFLGISASEVVSPKITSISHDNVFDNEVHRLHSQGFNYAQIARQMGASYDVVKAIGGGRYKKYHYFKSNPKKGGAKKKDWESIDSEYLPKVKQLVDTMCTVGEERPSKVSIGRVERLLEMRDKQMVNLPLCRDYVVQHIISQKRFWALTVEWAVMRLGKEGKPIHLTNIQRLTNMRKRYIDEAIPFLSKDTAEILTALFH